MFSEYEKLENLEKLFKFEEYEQHLEKISAEMEQLKIQMAECQNEEDSLKQQLAETKEETKMLLAKEAELKQMLQNLNDNIDAISDPTDELLADIYQFFINEITRTSEGETMNFVYRDNHTCSFRILKNGNGYYNLLDISPSHPNLEEIRKELLDNQDITGLLVLLRKYFISLSGKDKAEESSNIKDNEQNAPNDVKNAEDVQPKENPET